MRFVLVRAIQPRPPVPPPFIPADYGFAAEMELMAAPNSRQRQAVNACGVSGVPIDNFLDLGKLGEQGAATLEEGTR